MATRPLTYTDIWGNTPAEQIVEDVHGDGLQLLIGHIDATTAQWRIEVQPWYQPRLLVDPAVVEHAWIRLDQHAASCDHSRPVPLGQACPSTRCCWAPWIRWHWHETHADDPAALAVTFVELDDIPIDTAAALAAAGLDQTDAPSGGARVAA